MSQYRNYGCPLESPLKQGPKAYTLLSNKRSLRMCQVPVTSVIKYDYLESWVWEEIAILGLDIVPESCVVLSRAQDFTGAVTEKTPGNHDLGKAPTTSS